MYNTYVPNCSASITSIILVALSYNMVTYIKCNYVIPTYNICIFKTYNLTLKEIHVFVFVKRFFLEIF